MSTEAIVAAIPPPLLAAVCAAFADSQHHNASHRKNVHALIKLHAECSAEGSDGERAFFLSFLHCLHHVLNIRKCEELSNKLMRFLIGFMVRLSGEKTAAAGRFIENALLYALDNLDAKDKAVRVRLCQIVVAGVNGVEEVGDAVWELLQTKMVARLGDKEPAVRVHAIHAMSRLQALVLGPEAGGSVLNIFTSLLTVDPVAEVRKAALVHIDVNAQTLEGVLSRCRDVEPSIRRLFFAQKMLEIDIYHLSVEQRDHVLTSGLTDRDESVVRACIDMILSHWLPRTNSNIIGFLTSLDVVSNQEVAESALQSFFKVMPNIIDPRQESYLEHLTVEIAFVLRVYCEYVLKHSDQGDLQDALPGLSRLAKTLTVYYEYLVAVGDSETDKAEVEFILMELMTLCTALDGADEVGRRGCCQIAEEMMRNMSVSDALFGKCSKLLLSFSDSLDDFVSRMLLISSDFHCVLVDNDSGDETIQIMAQLRAVSCLSMVLNASDDCNLTKYPVLVGLLNELVIPAVNSRYALVQASGLECLGLFMLLSGELSLEYQQLFVDFLGVTSGATRNTALRVLFDLVIVHGLVDVCKQLSCMLYDPDPTVQSTAAEGFSKLLLHDKLPDDDLREVILGLLTLHYHPETKSNFRLRQCLSFFFHAYAFGSARHQQHIREMLCRAMTNLQPIKEVNLGTLFAHLCYLCDPLNLVVEQPRSDGSLVAEGPPSSASFNRTICELMYAGIALTSADPATASKFFVCASKLPVAPASDAGEAADEQMLLKEATYLAALCTKNGPGDRHCVAALKKLSAALASADTGMYALTQDRLDAIRGKIHGLCPALLALPSTGPLATAGQAQPKRRAKAFNTENILDNLQDMLE